MSDEQQTATPDFRRDIFTDFDVEDPEFNERFDDVLDELVAKCPMARSDTGHGYWVVNRWRDVRRCGQDWQTFSSADGWQVNRPEGAPWILPEESDPPYHNTWRRALDPYFSPKALAPYEPDIRRYANELIDGFIEAGECDSVGLRRPPAGDDPVPEPVRGPPRRSPDAVSEYRPRDVRPRRGSA